MLVTFEGIDGSGKSTQARRLVEHLRAENRTVLFVREPGGAELSERVRSLLLDPSLNVSPFAELLLFSAARAQLVAERIRPALEAGQIVVCDRFYDSTTAYQGAGRQLEDPSWIRSFNQKVTDGLVPDRTYLIEVPPDVAQERRQESDADRMEAGDENFYERVSAAYERLARKESDRFVTLDGQRPIEDLHAEIRADIEALLARRTGTAESGGGSSST